jgi:spore germination cell wall hydrolase CwlJ-like protein
MWNSHTIDGDKIQDVHKRYVEDAYPNNDEVWKKAVNIAKYINTIEDNTNGATSYYNPSKVTPKWGEGSESWTSTKQIGKHLFGKDSTSRYEP